MHPKVVLSLGDGRTGGIADGGEDSNLAIICWSVNESIEATEIELSPRRAQHQYNACII